MGAGGNTVLEDGPSPISRREPVSLARVWRLLTLFVLAALAVAPLVNVGPVNTSGLALLFMTGCWALFNPRQWWAYWRDHSALVSVLLFLVATAILINVVLAMDKPYLNSLRDMRWFVLLIVAAPCLVVALRQADWWLLGIWLPRLVALLIGIAAVDAVLHLWLGSDIVLEALGLARERDGRPSAAFNPHPYSRALIAAGLCVGFAVYRLRPGWERRCMMMSLAGCVFLLAAGGVRVSLLASLFVLAILARARLFTMPARQLGLAAAVMAAGLLYRFGMILDAGADYSVSRRWLLVTEAWEWIGTRPLLGFGYHASRRLEHEPEVLELLDLKAGEWLNTHVQWLEVTLDYGVVGLLGFILLWWMFLRTLWGAYATSAGAARVISLLLIGNGLSLSMATFFTVFVEAEWAIWMLTLIAALVIQEQMPAPQDPRRSPAPGVIKPAALYD